MEAAIPSSILQDLEGSELVEYRMDLLGGAITFRFSVMEDIHYTVEFREVRAFNWKTDFVLEEGERYHPELFGLYLRKCEEAAKGRPGFFERLRNRGTDVHFSANTPFNIILDFTAAGMFFLQAGVMSVNGRDYRLSERPVRYV